MDSQFPAAIRRARLEDLDGIVAVQKAADLAAFPHIFPPDQYPFPDEAVRQRWRASVSNQDFWVIVYETGDRIVGVAALNGALFDAIAVDPQHWGGAPAGLLHDAIVSHARGSSFGELRLWVMERNDRGRRFYTRRGWIPTGETKALPSPLHRNVSRCC